MGLLDAIEATDLAEISRCIRANYDVNELCAVSRTILTDAGQLETVEGLTTPLITAVQRGAAAIVEALLLANASPNLYPEGEDPPLIHAARLGDPSILTMLLNAGASVDILDVAGRSPLLWAVRMNRRHAVRILLDAGASQCDVAIEWAQELGRSEIEEMLRTRVGDNLTLRPDLPVDPFAAPKRYLRPEA